MRSKNNLAKYTFILKMLKKGKITFQLDLFFVSIYIWINFEELKFKPQGTKIGKKFAPNNINFDQTNCKTPRGKDSLDISPEARARPKATKQGCTKC